MRILYLVEATIAGVRRHVQTLATNFHAQGCAVTVACPLRRQHTYGEDDFVTELQEAGVSVVTLPLRREVEPLHDTQSLRAIGRLLGNGQFDLIHTHSSKAGFLGRLAARVYGVPTIHTPHALYFLGLSNPLKWQLYLRIEQALGAMSDRLVAVSSGERAIMLRHRLAPAERIVCIPNGIDERLIIAAPKPVQRQELGVPEGVPLIGTVARLEAQKNPEMFVRAATLVLRALPDAHFVWCGGGSLAQYIQRLALDLGIADRCRFIGYRPDAPAVLAAFDLFWLTSNFEGQAYALLEALALRKPVIATDVVGNHDVVTDSVHGLLVPRNDANALARASLLLLAQPKRALALASAGHDHVVTYYTSRSMLAATAQLYHEVGKSSLYLQEPANREVSFDRQPRYVGDG